MPSELTAQTAQPRSYLVFHVAGQRYGAPLHSVDEVIRGGEVTPVPGARPDLLGILQLRGRIVPVLDGHRRFGLAATPVDATLARIVVLSCNGHQVGVRVDSVGELLHSGGAAEPPPPGRASRADDPVEGVLPLGEHFVALVHVARLCRLAGTGAGAG
jgi:purine-binding chemotaxis protein CheW